MSLAAGTRLGPYEVLSLIGAGGMGEVYRARDTRLDRSVAIKVLPTELASDAERRARFEREARTISTLTHPHICALYDVGDHDGVPYLVMEHLAGETLAARLAKGPLPLEQALDLGAQIAEALDAAHKHGIVHRDLKPANVMLTKAGAVQQGALQAKLLDFGLAKLRPPEGVRLVRDSSATVTQGPDVTAAGTLVGTLPYMAPEQVEGREADARTDLWALGCLLYEMVTGQRAFEGATTGSLVGAILAKEPVPLASRQPLTPPALERLVKRCLAKDPDQRWDSAHDVADELRWVAERGAAISDTPVSTTRRHRWVRRGGWAVALAAVGLVGAWVGARTGVLVPAQKESAGAGAIRHLAVVLPADAPLWLDPSTFKPSLALTPDGSIIAYTCGRGSGTQICLRRLDRPDASPMPGTENGRYPAFSPDGRSLLFCVATSYSFCGAQAPLRRLSIINGRVDAVGELPEGLGFPLTLDWTTDDTVVLGSSSGIWTMPATGGPGIPLWRTTQPKEFVAEFGGWLAGGARLLMSVRARKDEGGFSDEIRALTVETGEQRVVVNGFQPSVLPTGHLFYRGVDRSEFFGATFDQESLAVGPPVRFWERIRTTGDWPVMSLSRSGTLLYLPVEFDRVLTWIDRESRRVPAFAAHGAWQSPQLSPDGRRVAIEVLSDPARPSIAVVDLARGAVTEVSQMARAPLWTPDGTRVLFESGDEDSIEWKASDGTGTPQTIHARLVGPGSWAPDGRTLLAEEIGAAGPKVVSLTREGDGWVARPFLAPSSFGGRFSPDGRWVAYASMESGAAEVWVRAWPSADRRIQVSVGGGHGPVWSADGRELFYRNGQGFYTVSVTHGSTLTVGAPHLLFEGPYLDDQWGRSFDVSPDGQRFLVVQVGDEERAPRRLHLIENWFEELKAKVPSGQAK